MSKQDKGNLCECRCGQRKTSRKRRFAPGHPILGMRPGKKKVNKQYASR
jgi:hypothetical protein